MHYGSRKELRVRAQVHRSDGPSRPGVHGLQVAEAHCRPLRCRRAQMILLQRRKDRLIRTAIFHIRMTCVRGRWWYTTSLIQRIHCHQSINR